MSDNFFSLTRNVTIKPSTGSSKTRADHFKRDTAILPPEGESPPSPPLSRETIIIISFLIGLVIVVVLIVLAASSKEE